MFKNILCHLYLLICISVQIILIKAQDCLDSRSRPGKCIALAKCPDIMEEFYDQTRMTSDVIDFQSFISNYVCGSDGVDYMICCRSRSLDKVMMPDSQMHSQHLSRISSYPGRKSTIKFAPLKPPTSVNNPKPSSRPVNRNTPSIIFAPIAPVQQIPPPPQQISTSQEEYQPPMISANNQETGTATGSCGTNQIFLNRIVGGSEAKKGNYPWIAALGYYDNRNPSTFQFECGGSLITSRHILTAAHCIKDHLTVVRLGAYDYSSKAEPNARNYRIKRIIVHEQYEMTTILDGKRWVINDIAIIELSKRVVMTRSINTICLPEDPKFMQENFVYKNLFVAGWGAQFTQGFLSNILRDTQVPIANLRTCAQKYQQIVDFSKHDNKVICAGNGFDTTCYGDSGGPLMMPQLKGSKRRYYLIGIVSYAYECNSHGFPGVYTKVAAFMPWIKNVIS